MHVQRNTEEHGGRGKVEGEHRERGTLEEGGITSSYRTAKGRSPQLVQNFMETQRIVGNSVSGCWASRSDRPAGEKRHRSLAFHHVNMLLTEIKPSFTRPDDEMHKGRRPTLQHRTARTFKQGELCPDVHQTSKRQLFSSLIKTERRQQMISHTVQAVKGQLPHSAKYIKT